MRRGHILNPPCPTRRVCFRGSPRSSFGDVDLAIAVADDGEAEAVARSFMAAGYEVASLLEQHETNRLAGARVHDPEADVGLDLPFAMSERG